MGISGLLPLLKSIQVNRHLSEFAGQTLAVDAYVWLHRGVYACATDLANGKSTSRYVEYAMQRIRQLRHHHIQPYVVFDGGPLPAKKGTEVERKKRREESLLRGKALAAQGRHTEARDFFVKCVDVTPQMAFQLIKALRAEDVPYVVAPYEADAQMAYLERIGLVDGIITEDSDLLVFGCRNVLFKFDSVSCRLDAISRADFGAVADGSGSGISLRGWSDTEFRAMAIMSGCDYLPSIPGIGLKTAYTLLRKWKTVDNAVRSIRLEGKKAVPRGYLEQFRLAEKVFLHQRVYDPGSERLVHLTELPPGEEWDDAKEAYVGCELDPAFAKSLAEGNVDPVTLDPMEDINPSYRPPPPKAKPLGTKDENRAKHTAGAAGKGKAPAKVQSATLHTFFGPNAKIPPTAKSVSQPKTDTSVIAKPTMVVGRASGKRTLAGVMDHDIAVKKTRLEHTVHTESRFFGAGIFEHGRSDMQDEIPVAGPSRQEKENLAPRLSAPMGTVELLAEFEEPMDPVTQEEGYLSPGETSSRCVSPDPMSSPPRMHGTSNPADFDADPISSPGVPRTQPRRPRSRERQLTLYTEIDDALVLARATPEAEDAVFTGPDLRDPHFRDTTSEIDCSDVDTEREETATPTPSPLTPPDEDVADDFLPASGSFLYEFDGLDEEGTTERDLSERTHAVATGWWKQWGRGSTTHRAGGDSNQLAMPRLRRSDTCITPAGRHSARQNLRPVSAPDKAGAKRAVAAGSARRKTLVFQEQVKTNAPPVEQLPEPDLEDDTIIASAAGRLSQFRCQR